MYCVNCGKQMSDNSKFCEYCGKPVDIGGSSAQQSQNVGQPEVKQAEVNKAAPGQTPPQAPYNKVTPGQTPPQAPYNNAVPGQTPPPPSFKNGGINPPPVSPVYNSNGFAGNEQAPQPVEKKSKKKTKIALAIVVPVAVLSVVLAVVIGVLFSGDSKIEKAFENGDVTEVGQLLESYYPDGAKDDTSRRYFYEYYLETGEINKAADVYLSYLEQSGMSPENEYYLTELEKITMHMSYENYIRYYTAVAMYSYIESDLSQYFTEEGTQRVHTTEADEVTTEERTTAEQTTVASPVRGEPADTICGVYEMTYGKACTVRAEITKNGEYRYIEISTIYNGEYLSFTGDIETYETEPGNYGIFWTGKDEHSYVAMLSAIYDGKDKIELFIRTEDNEMIPPGISGCYYRVGTNAKENDPEIPKYTADNFVGTYWDLESKRANMDCVKNADGSLSFSIHWGGGAAYSSNWYFSGVWNESTQQLEYTNGKKLETDYSSGSPVETTIFSESSGRLYLDSGYLFWEDEKEDADESRIFKKVGGFVILPYIDAAPEGIFDDQISGMYRVKTDGSVLNVRSGCGLDYEVIDQLAHETDISVLGIYGDWAYITHSYGVKGFTSGEKPHELYGWVNIEFIEGLPIS